MEVIYNESTLKRKNNLLIAIASLLIIKYCLFIGIQINFLVSTLWDAAAIRSSYTYLCLVLISITLLVLLLIYSVDFKRVNYTKNFDIANIVIIIISIIVIIVLNLLWIFEGADFLRNIVRTNFFRHIIRWDELMFIVEILYDILSMIVIILLTFKIQKIRLNLNRNRNYLITPWILIPIWGLMIGLLIKLIDVFIEFEGLKLIDIYFWYTTTSSLPVFYAIYYFTLIAYGLVGLGIGIELLVRTLKIKKNLLGTTKDYELFGEEKREDFV